MRVRTSYSLSWTNTRVISLNLRLMNLNQYALMDITDPSILFLSSFFDPFLVNDL